MARLGSGCGLRHDGVEIEMLRGGRRQSSEQRREIAVLAGLDQPEMALGQANAASRGSAPKTASRALRSRRAPAAVSLAADTVEDHAGDRTAGSCAAKPRTSAAADCAWRATSSDEHDRQLKRAAISAVAPRRPVGAGGTIEQTHDAFDDQHIGVARGVGGERIDEVVRHRPGVEINARRTSDGGVKRRVDIVGSGFRRRAPRRRGAPAPPTTPA